MWLNRLEGLVSIRVSEVVSRSVSHVTYYVTTDTQEITLPSSFQMILQSAVCSLKSKPQLNV